MLFYFYILWIYFHMTVCIVDEITRCENIIFYYRQFNTWQISASALSFKKNKELYVLWLKWASTFVNILTHFNKHIFRVPKFSFLTFQHTCERFYVSFLIFFIVGLLKMGFTIIPHDPWPRFQVYSRIHTRNNVCNVHLDMWNLLKHS